MNSAIETLSGVREIYEEASYTSWERLRMWWRRVLSALWDRPPNTYCKPVRVGPDDPRWGEGMPISYQWMNFADEREIWGAASSGKSEDFCKIAIDDWRRRQK